MRGRGVQDCHSKCYTEVSHTRTGDMTSGGGDEEAARKVRKRSRRVCLSQPLRLN